MKKSSIMLGFAFATLGAPLFAQSKAPKEPQALEPAFCLAKADQVIGLDVRDGADKSRGEIGELLVDPHSGEIRYAVLEVGGFLGMGEERRVVPYALVRVAPDEKDPKDLKARTALTEAQIRAAPTCKKDQALDADLDRKVEAAFGADEAWRFTGTGKPAFVRVGSLDDLVVKDPANVEVGKVKDIVLAPRNNCVAFVVIDATKDAGGKDTAVPFTKVAFVPDREGKLTATTAVQAMQLKSAPAYDATDWKRMCGAPWITELHTYYECEPFWKSPRFSRVHDAAERRP